MPIIDLSKFKVIYKDKVLRAIAIDYLEFPEPKGNSITVCEKPKFIGILVINEDGQIIALRDEAWMFQFVPIIS